MPKSLYLDTVDLDALIELLDAYRTDVLSGDISGLYGSAADEVAHADELLDKLKAAKSDA